MSSIREECGVFGIYSHEETDVAHTAYYGLFALQHRGQESCGIVVNDDGVFSSYKDTGLVNDVFTPEILDSFGKGRIAVMYATVRQVRTAETMRSPSLSITSKGIWRLRITEIS